MPTQSPLPPDAIARQKMLAQLHADNANGSKPSGTSSAREKSSHRRGQHR